MKRGAIIFVSLLVLIFAGLCIVVAVAVSGSPEHFVSSTGEREWARADYESLFVTPAEPLPVLPSEPLVVRKMEETKNDVEFTFPKIENAQMRITRFGTRIDAAPGQTEVTLPDGNTLRFLGVATYLPEKLHEGHQYGSTELTWHDPETIEPLDEATVTKRNLERNSRFDLSERTLILAFDVSDPDLPHSWQSLNIKNADTLCRIHSSSSAQTREKVRYHSLELDLFNQAELMALLSISHGIPETQTIDPGSILADEPVFFESGSVRFTIPFKHDGNQNSTSFSGDGGDTKIGFRWNDDITGYQKSFAVIDFQPAVHGNQIEWRTTNPEKKNRRYWRKAHEDEGLSSLVFKEILTEVGPIEVRHFPAVTHVAFRLNSIPGLPELDNLFEANSGPIRFKYDSDVKRFLSQSTQTRNRWNGKIWPDSAYPLEFDNITPGEVIAKIEALKGIQLHVDPKAHEIDEWEPKPLLERLSDWFKSIF